MAKVTQECSDCKGAGNVPHQARILAADEIRPMNDLDTFKTIDICEACNGAGRRAYDVKIEERTP